MVIRMRHTRAHTKNRRSHHALSEPALVACNNCKVEKENHRVCHACGQYNGKQVLNVVESVVKKQISKSVATDDKKAMPGSGEVATKDKKSTAPDTAEVVKPKGKRITP